MTRTIDITPTWRGVLPLLLTVHENSTPKGREDAIAELYRMADLADAYVAMQKAQAEPGPLTRTVEEIIAKQEAKATAKAKDE